MHYVVWKRHARWQYQLVFKTATVCVRVQQNAAPRTSLLSTIALLRSVNSPIVTVHYFLQQVCISLCESVCACMHGGVCTLKGKRLELSTSNLAHIYPVAVAWKMLTRRSKGQRSRSHGYKNRHGCKTVTDARLPMAVCAVLLPVWAARRTTVSVFYSSSRTDSCANLSRRHTVYTCNAGGHEAGRVACNQCPRHHLCKVRLTRWSHSIERSQLYANCAETTDTTQHIR